MRRDFEFVWQSARIKDRGGSWLFSLQHCLTHQEGRFAAFIVGLTGAVATKSLAGFLVAITGIVAELLGFGGRYLDGLRRWTHPLEIAGFEISVVNPSILRAIILSFRPFIMKRVPSRKVTLVPVSCTWYLVESKILSALA